MSVRQTGQPKEKFPFPHFCVSHFQRPQIGVYNVGPNRNRKPGKMSKHGDHVNYYMNVDLKDSLRVEFIGELTQRGALT